MRRSIEARTAVLDKTGKRVEFYSSKPWRVDAITAAEMIADGRAIFDGEGRIAVTRSPRQIRGWSCSIGAHKMEKLAGPRTLFVQLILGFLRDHMKRLTEEQQRFPSSRPRPTINESQLTEREREIMKLLRQRAGESDP